MIYIYINYQLQLGLCQVTVLHKNEQYVHSNTQVVQNTECKNINTNCKNINTGCTESVILIHKEIQGGPDSIRQFLIINNQSNPQHPVKWESTFCCR
jgi:hypothetical protein